MSRSTLLARCLLPLSAMTIVTPALAQMDDSVHTALFSARDAYVALAFVGATAALTPFDRRVAVRLQNPDTQANRFLHHSATDLELFAAPGAYVIGAGLYAVGKLGHYPRLADLGVHGTEAVIVGTAVTGLLKGLAGRARPFVVSDTNPRDFKFGKGFTDETRTSFPSGHTTTAFAAAAAVTHELGHQYPHAKPYIATVMYGGASLVALSRMYHNKHWASDVILGAGIGTFSGIKVVQYNHNYPHNRVNRWLLSTAIAPDGNGGARIGWSVATH